MSLSDYLEGLPWVRGEQKRWSPAVKIILAFIVALLAMTPAILGIYWELLLPP